ncbi:adenylosuccinate lyase [Caproicibacter sp. BJN0012]|uniref:adenylosuccinate lyase n=1 Tax=Caproicibacter sp. BJN0012 TaxID=3110227 RepID=UPI002E1028BA
MGRKYLRPDTEGYLLEAEACKEAIRELERLAAKLERKVAREKAKRQTEFAQVMAYRSEIEIQDDYGYGFLTERQYDHYLELFRAGSEAMENHPPTVVEIAEKVVRRVIRDIFEDQQEWQFSALSPEQQEAERKRAEQAQLEWKRKIAEIKKRRGIFDNDENTSAGS